MNILPTLPLRRVFRVVNGGTPTPASENWGGEIPWVTPMDLAPVDGRIIKECGRTLTQKGLSSGSTCVPKGSLIVSTRAPIGYVAEVPCPTAFNQGCRGLVPLRPVDIRFFRYQLSARGDFLGSRGQGSTFAELSTDSLASIHVVVPSIKTQNATADYLDTETARIDALIEKKQQMIDLLDERFEAAVFSAITRGVDGRRPVRSTVLTWIAEIPADWATPTVSMNFDLQLGKMLNADAAAGPEQHPYLRNVNVQWGRFDFEDLASMHFDMGDRRRCELRVGDLLVCEGGEVGRAAVWAGEVSDCYYQKAIHRVRPRHGSNGRYLMYCLRAAAKMSVFAVEGNLSTIVHLTGEQLRVHRFPWPSSDEQARIVRYLDDIALRHAELNATLEHQVDLLTERRHALITAAVTGELDIPTVAA